MGQSTRTMLSQIVAEFLGGDLENINVITGDSSAVPIGIGGSASRQTVTAGSSALLAAKEVRNKLLKVAATLLEVSEKDLEIVKSIVQDKFGYLDILINNAGIAPNRLLEDQKLDEWEKVIKVNLKAN